jgi:hypothetical protein
VLRKRVRPKGRAPKGRGAYLAAVLKPSQFDGEEGRVGVDNHCPVPIRMKKKRTYVGDAKSSPLSAR